MKKNKNDFKIDIDYCLHNFPLRLSITDYCNLACFFCSNEGMDLRQRNKNYVDIFLLKRFIKILANRGLKKISITGGEPSLHPKILDIVNFLNQFNFRDLFFHTNGINLNEVLMGELLKKFTKIAVSIHSMNFDTWTKITGGRREHFDKLLSNLSLLSESSKGLDIIIELKFVPIRGYNDSNKEFLDFLKYCSDKKFKFKFLNFEPILAEHIKKVIPFNEIKRKLIRLGCFQSSKKGSFRGQNNYLPIEIFHYKNTRGVAIEIGCGDSKVCNSCYLSNEIFVTPDFKIKPCHIDNFSLDLLKYIKNKDVEKILYYILESRKFLSTAPGANIKVWQPIKKVKI